MTRVVVKIGTSSLTDEEGRVDTSAVAKLCREAAGLRADGIDAVIVTSAAIAAGLPELGLGGDKRPSDARTLQAVATVCRAFADLMTDRQDAPADASDSFAQMSAALTRLLA